MDILQQLKQNLEIPTAIRDEYLRQLIRTAKEVLTREGIPEPEEENGYYPPEYQNLVVMYAAYYYRKRADDRQRMPDMLRYARNSYLMKVKMEAET